VKARHGLGLGDSCAAALALATHSPLMTADSDFLPLAERGLKLDWLG
jgi:predicted nucleic acid-binding protein